MRKYKGLEKSGVRALRTLLILSVAITGIWGMFVTSSRSTPTHTTQNPKPTEPVVLREKRPELGVESSIVARLKLASRKNYYRIGELISLDSALINLSGKPVFLKDLKGIEFSATDNAGKEIDVVQYINISSDITLDSFRLVQPGELIQHTVNILVGCNKQAFKNLNLMLDAKDDRKVFEHELFVSWGQGCLDIKRSGTYAVSGKRTNEYVIVTSDSPNTRTAVGAMKSNALKIIVSK